MSDGPLVVDASSAVAYLLGDGGDAERRGLVHGEPHAPSLIDVEVTQTLRGLVRGGHVSIERVEVARGDAARLAVRRHPDAPLLRRAWELRGVCTTCDGLYVALAEALDAPLVTRDARLARGVGQLVEVVVAG